jgi:hypothetical protein
VILALVLKCRASDIIEELGIFNETGAWAASVTIWQLSDVLRRQKSASQFIQRKLSLFPSINYRRKFLWVVVISFQRASYFN